MELDPGSIGKGFAVDSVVKILRNLGVTSAFISAGGSTLYAIGAVPGSAGWPVDVPDPRHPGKTAATILLKDTSLSTGACTEKFFIKNGHRYCHIFDPRTMRPVEGMLQTTVINPSATDSDALSTVVFVLDPAASRRLLASMPTTQALIFNQSGQSPSHPSRLAALNQTCGYQVAAHADYRALLDRKDLDAVVVATPLGLHAQHVLPALESGHHVYGEKTMAYTIEDAAKIVNATTAHKRIFQVGHQYRYSPWIRAAVARVQQGEIGDVTHILAYWNRNNNWRRPVPDPSLERLLNWRLYNQWSLGLLAELGSHHMDIANWVFGSPPASALASGSICYYHDGRETDDNVQAILSYSGGRRFIFTSMTDNAKMGDQLWLYGTKGSLNLTLQDATFFYEPDRITKAPAKDGKGVTTSASYNPSGEMPYRGPGKPIQVTTAEHPNTTATRTFVYCCRTGARPIADQHVGF